MPHAYLNVSPTLHNLTSMERAVNIAFRSAQSFITSCDKSNMFKPIKLLSKQTISLYLILPPPPPPLSYLTHSVSHIPSYALMHTLRETERSVVNITRLSTKRLDYRYSIYNNAIVFIAKYHSWNTYNASWSIIHIIYAIFTVWTLNTLAAVYLMLTPTWYCSSSRCPS